MRMQGGKLRDFVTIQSFEVDSIGTRGEQIGEWTDLYVNVPAQVKGLTGREATLARQILATSDTLVTIRFMEGITTKNRIVFNSQTFNIEQITNTENRNRELVIGCKGLA